MFFWILVAAVVVGAAVRTTMLIRTDGLGSRPAPRSHAAETIGSTWPQRDGAIR